MATATQSKLKRAKTATRAVEFEKPTAIHATPLEVAKFFSVSKWAVYRAIHAGKIEYAEVFGQYRIPWRVVLAMSPSAFEA